MGLRKIQTDAGDPKYRICLVAIYIGALPGWLPVWLRSCEMNELVDFLLLTDNPEAVPYCPANVRVERTSLHALQARFSEATGIKVALNHSFKVCDFRPVFGLAFSDLLKGFDFWGHTDLDLLYGRLRDFIKDEHLDTYVRLYHRGHLSIFRNDAEGNTLFRLPHPVVDWRQAFSTDQACYFDEVGGIEQIMRFNKIQEFEDNYAFADIVPRFPDYRLTRKELNRQRQIFVYENGRVSQLYAVEGELRRRDFMYMHLQKRQFPNVDAASWRALCMWSCTPQGFIPKTSDHWEIEDLLLYNRPNYSHAFHYALTRAARRLNRSQGRKTS